MQFWCVPITNTYLEVGKASMNDTANDTPTNTTGLVSHDDDDKLIDELDMPGDHQIVWLGLAVAAFMLFGSVFWG